MGRWSNRTYQWETLRYRAKAFRPSGLSLFSGMEKGSLRKMRRDFWKHNINLMPLCANLKLNTYYNWHTKTTISWWTPKRKISTATSWTGPSNRKHHGKGGVFKYHLRTTYLNSPYHAWLKSTGLLGHRKTTIEVQEWEEIAHQKQLQREQVKAEEPHIA